MLSKYQQQLIVQYAAWKTKDQMVEKQGGV